jgi:hypothetical protein
MKRDEVTLTLDLPRLSDKEAVRFVGLLREVFNRVEDYYAEEIIRHQQTRRTARQQQSRYQRSIGADPF